MAKKNNSKWGRHKIINEMARKILTKFDTNDEKAKKFFKK